MSLVDLVRFCMDYFGC